MGILKKTTISLPAEMLADIKATVEAGDYTSISEAIRDALRHWRRSRAVLVLNDKSLQRLVTEGRGSGDPVDGTETLERLRAKYVAMSLNRTY